jgi:PAS domain S-box-containing protein
MSVIIETTERKRVEDAHRESEAVLRSFFDSPGVMRGILELVDGRIFHVSCNKAAAEMYSVNPESVLGKSAPEVGTLEEAERMWTGLCEQSRIAGKPISIETAGRDASGLERWLLATCAYVGMGPSGNPRFAYTTFDFTERKRAEEALRESEKRFRALVTASSDVVYRVSPDWTEMRQLRGRDFLADTETPSRTWLHKYIHPDDQPRVLAAIEDAIRSKTVFELEHRVLRVDGTLGWTFSRAIPLLDSSGEIVEWLGAASDITERKRAEEALRESEERFRIMADGCPAIIWVTDAEGGNRFVNRAYHEFFGMMPEQVEGGKWQPLVHPDDAPLYMEAMVRAVRQRAPFRAEARVRRADGEWRWIASYGEPLLSASGEYLGHAGISPDITESKALADQLREQIEELETVMEVAPVAIWVAHDPPCQQITGNRMADRFYEAAAGENVSANVTAVRRFFQGGRELQPQELPMQEAAARGVDIRNSELEVLLPSGRLMNMLGNASPLRDAAGQVRGCVGTFLDITERKLAEGALRDSEERLRLTLDGTGLGTFEFRPETNESLWDAGAKAAWGLPAGAEITFPQVLEGIHPDDRSRVRATMEAALLAGSPESSEAEYRVIWPDGSVHWILGKSRTSFVGEGDQRRAVRMIGVHQDITARKRAEEALRESESRFRALLESAAQGVLAVDETGRILLVNARTEELFGYSRDELIGQPLEVLVPEDLQASHAGHKRQYFANPRTRQMGAGLDLRGIKKGGGDISLEISLSFVEEGGKRLALALITDVTERKRAEERLRQTQKLESLGLLAGGVAHDFNNLLVGVIGNASLAQEMLPPDHPAADLLHAVLKTGEQAAHLTRQMLAYSGKGKFVVEPLNLSALIPDMCGLVRPSISKKIALQFDLEKNLPAVEADRGQVQQVFMNLTLNAAEAIGDQEGLVTVRTGIQEVDGRYARLHQGTEALPPGKYVYLEVRDTGCGMDEATKAKVFDPFFSTKFMGRGLGLAAVSGILRGHKAAITVSSASGKGSCFTVLFPAAEGTAEKPVVGARAAAVHGAGVVLVVDDEQLIREMAKRALERHGYTVLLADSGPEAINIFKKDPAEISMVILDLSMPHMSGEEVLPELRKIRPKVKFLVSSGYSEAEAMTLFKGQRVSGFVQKPYTSNDLAEKVMECLG